MLEDSLFGVKFEQNRTGYSICYDIINSAFLGLCAYRGLDAGEVLPDSPPCPPLSKLPAGVEDI